MKLLLIDDDDAVVDYLVEALRARGYDCTGTTSAHDALARASRFDLLVCDIEMPEMRGPDLLARLRSERETPSLIFMTAFGSVDLAVACMREGAARFGWDRRVATPGSVRDGRFLVGMGMSAAIRSNYLMPARATVGLNVEGVATIRQAMTDIGTGTYTILAQVAAEALGLRVQDIRVDIGDSDFPPAPGSGGSFGAASAAGAVLDAAMADPALGHYRPWLEDVRRYGNEIEAAVYFCVLEALQNAGKHAGESATITVRVASDAEQLRFDVSDDGVGFDVGGGGQVGHGFVNMADRLGAFGGTLDVTSAPGRGTTITGGVSFTFPSRTACVVLLKKAENS